MRWLPKTLAVILLATATLTPSAALLAQQPAPKPSEQPKEQIVYITRTGKRYHRLGCRYLRKTAMPMSLKDAKQQGYTPCKVCHPAQ
jgi:hypothetical protein